MATWTIPLPHPHRWARLKFPRGVSAEVYQPKSRDWNAATDAFQLKANSPDAEGFLRFAALAWIRNVSGYPEVAPEQVAMHLIREYWDVLLAVFLGALELESQLAAQLAKSTAARVSDRPTTPPTKSAPNRSAPAYSQASANYVANALAQFAGKRVIGRKIIERLPDGRFVSTEFEA